MAAGVFGSQNCLRKIENTFESKDFSTHKKLWKVRKSKIKKYIVKMSIFIDFFKEQFSESF